MNFAGQTKWLNFSEIAKFSLAHPFNVSFSMAENKWCVEKSLALRVCH